MAGLPPSWGQAAFYLGLLIGRRRLISRILLESGAQVAHPRPVGSGEIVVPISLGRLRLRRESLDELLNSRTPHCRGIRPSVLDLGGAPGHLSRNPWQPGVIRDTLGRTHGRRLGQGDGRWRRRAWGVNRVRLRRLPNKPQQHSCRRHQTDASQHPTTHRATVVHAANIARLTRVGATNGSRSITACVGSRLLDTYCG